MTLLISAACAGAVLLFACGVLLYSFLRKSGGSAAGYVLIPLLGCDDPEQRVRNAYWEEKQKSPANRRPILIVTSLDSGQRYLAGLLAAELDGVSTCDITALADYVLKNERMHKY